MKVSGYQKTNHFRENKPKPNFQTSRKGQATRKFKYITQISAELKNCKKKMFEWAIQE